MTPGSIVSGSAGEQEIAGLNSYINWMQQMLPTLDGAISSASAHGESNYVTFLQNLKSDLTARIAEAQTVLKGLNDAAAG